MGTPRSPQPPPSPGKDIPGAVGTPRSPQSPPAQVRTFQKQTAQHKEGIPRQPQPHWECEVLPTLRNASQSSCLAPCVPSFYSKEKIFQDSTCQGVPAELPQPSQCPSSAPQAGLSSEPGTSTIFPGAPAWTHALSHIPHPISQLQVLPSPGPALPSPLRDLGVPQGSRCPLPRWAQPQPCPLQRCHHQVQSAKVLLFLHPLKTLKTEQNKQKKDFHHHLQIH